MYGAELYRDDLNKVSFILSNYQDHLDSVEEFPDLKAGTWGGKGEHALFGDLGVRGIDKAHAVRVLVEHLGADLADTIATGDAKVDIPAQSVCMGSGGMEAKEAADWVTTDVDDDGLWDAFAHLGLIDQEQAASRAALVTLRPRHPRLQDALAAASEALLPRF